LLELVTVIVIMGILATVAMPVYFNYKTNAANCADKAVIAMIKDMANRMHLKTIAASGGRDTSWPNAATLMANITQPTMRNGYATTNEWCYISTGSFLIFYCPHADMSNRQTWLYFCQDLSSFYKAGSWLTVYSTGHP
jgi:type II secretory pathway pseudopilin PulG